MEISTTTRRSGRVARVLVNALCAATTLLALGLLAPAALGYERYVINGSSMSGSIELGSVVFAEVVPVDQLEVGDVITYMPPPESGIDHLVTHRIVEIHGDSFVTKGDANAQADPWQFRLSQDEQARVAYDVPHVGWLFLALQDRQLRMLLIGVPAGLVALISLVQLVGAVRRRPGPSEPPVGVPSTRMPVGGPVGG